MSNIINGERALGMNILRQLKESIPDLDVDWLLFGDTSKKLYINENTNVIQESTSDPGKEMLMRYLEDEDIQERILELITKKTK
ncbi:hypothetical protein [uncultured Flavobacterium sp.]|uniref:hypothetical protein n=1 Tax=uncultured Flavobacterium sp. TaxID=165435 RepID=UPI0025F976A3|nr:hypothetical protein [uncultured Flavobacterium sp.]